ncbi:hypothetical protein TH62_14385 [Bacillus sp. TH008]|nr:hypothetical protein TH62_14385 [Bacillus sp. TH008]
MFLCELLPEVSSFLHSLTVFRFFFSAVKRIKHLHQRASHSELFRDFFLCIKTEAADTFSSSMLDAYKYKQNINKTMLLD